MVKAKLPELQITGLGDGSDTPVITVSFGSTPDDAPASGQQEGDDARVFPSTQPNRPVLIEENDRTEHLSVPYLLFTRRGDRLNGLRSTVPHGDGAAILAKRLR
jgi:hypothetical protein